MSPGSSELPDFLADPKPLWTGPWGGGVRGHKKNYLPGQLEMSLFPPSCCHSAEGRISPWPLWTKGRRQGLPGQSTSSLLFWDTGQMRLRRGACLGSEDVWAARMSQRQKQQGSSPSSAKARPPAWKGRKNSSVPKRGGELRCSSLYSQPRAQ